MTTRRELLTKLPALGVSLGLGQERRAVSEVGPVATIVSAPERARNPLLNQLGYRPLAAKHVMVPRRDGLDRARVVRVDPGKVGEVLKIGLSPSGHDFGEWLIGDFSNVREPGSYRIAVPFKFASGDPSGQDDWSRGVVEQWSHDFTIGEDVNDAALRAMVDYYRIQSCGASTKGYNTPCHTGSIRRDDGGPAGAITGGWHSADDHVRDLPEILHGLFGLLALAEARPDMNQDEGLLNEIRWGNDYFLRVQDPRGHVCFGVYPRDYYGVKDSWNVDEYLLVTRPAPRYCQHLFIAAQATIARLYRTSASDYAGQCLEAGLRCYRRWEDATRGDGGGPLNLYDLGTGAFAAAELFRVTGERAHREAARGFAQQIVAAQTQEGDWPEIAGRADDPDPDYDLLNARALYPAYAPVGLAMTLRALPEDVDAGRWRDALARFTRGYVGHFLEANGFAIVPQSPFLSASAPHTRRWGARRFRYFLDTSTTRLKVPGSRPIPWQAGHNGIVAGYGVALAMIAKLIEGSNAGPLAQRQWDWIVGLNPSDTCHILGFGRNNPVTYPPVDFQPAVPQIVGAAMQGFVGDDTDQPVVVGGYYATGEFWMPQHSWTLWLGALLSTQTP